MNITFVLPKVSRYPVGGYKMVFEYANRLYYNHHTVSILYLNDTFMQKYKLPMFVRRLIAKYYVNKEPDWFDLNNEIYRYSNLDNNKLQKLILYTDIVIATAAQTVDFVNKKFDCKKLYYIQGFENWNMSNEDLISTYNLDIKKIVVGNWLKQIVDKYSPVESRVIRNPVDISVYKETKCFEQRPKHSIALLYNELPIKGFKYAYAALLRIKEKYSDLIVYIFGRTDYPCKLPKWIHYTKNADQEKTVEIYNSARVFLCASIEEGYGLTGLESMACGCVLVSTSYKGVLEYANEDNALLSPVCDVDELARNVCLAFEDTELCKKIRYESKKTVANLSWEVAVENFEKSLIEELQR